MPELKAAVLPVTQFQQNCAILWDEGTKDALITDPGGDVPRILAAIDQLGVHVTKILLTHGHIDHAGGAAALRQALADRAAPDPAPPIEGPDPRDAFLLDGLEDQAANYGFAGVRNVRPDRWLTEGEAITLGAPGAPGALAPTSSMIAIGAPVGTVSPSFAISSRMTPLTGEGTSALTLSVETSTNASYFSTESPTRLSHCATVPSVTVSPSCGIVIVVDIQAVPSLRPFRISPARASRQPSSPLRS